DVQLVGGVSVTTGGLRHHETAAGQRSDELALDRGDQAGLVAEEPVQPGRLQREAVLHVLHSHGLGVGREGADRHPVVEIAEEKSTDGRQPRQGLVAGKGRCYKYLARNHWVARITTARSGMVLTRTPGARSSRVSGWTWIALGVIAFVALDLLITGLGSPPP